MGGENSVLDMLVRYRQNMAMLRKKSIFKSGNNYLLAKEEYTFRKGDLDYKKATKEQLIEIRVRIRKERRQAWIQLTVTFSIVAILVIGVLITIGINVFEEDHRHDGENQKAQFEQHQKENEYNFLINDGDNWYKQGKWYNASFEYNKALELYPNDYASQYRLARTYLEMCRYKVKHNEIDYCQKFDLLISQLISENPEADSLKVLKKNFLEFNNALSMSKL